MTNRATSLVPCLAATMLASAALLTLQFQPAWSADDCLAKPKEGVAGKHWYYRIDRATKRQCWYLRDDDHGQGASLATRKTAAQDERAKLSSATANAHAEYETQASSGNDDVKLAPSPEPAKASGVVPSVAAPVADAGPTQGAADSSAAPADASTVATRWPEPTATTLQAPADPVQTAPSYKLAAASAPAIPAEASASPAMPEPVRVSDTSSSFSSALSTDDASRTQLFAFLGAVALTGFATSVLFARARARRRIQLAPAQMRRSAHWPVEPELDRMQLAPMDDYPSLPQPRDLEQPRRSRLSVVPQDDVHYEEQYQVEDLLARYSGQNRRRS